MFSKKFLLLSASIISFNVVIAEARSVVAPGSSRGYKMTTNSGAESVYGISFGYDFDLGSKITSSSSSGGSVYEAQEYEDAFEDIMTIKFDYTGNISKNSEFFLGLSYSYGEGNRVRLGSSGGSDVFADFGDYEAYAFEGGYRQFVDAGFQNFNPYFFGSAGLKYVDGISANLSGGQSGSVSIYEDSIVPTIGLGLGAFVDMSSYRFGIEAALKYDFELRGDASSGGINDQSSRIYAPVLIKGDMSF